MLKTSWAKYKIRIPYLRIRHLICLNTRLDANITFITGSSSKSRLISRNQEKKKVTEFTEFTVFFAGRKYYFRRFLLWSKLQLNSLMSSTTSHPSKESLSRLSISLDYLVYYETQNTSNGNSSERTPSDSLIWTVFPLSTSALFVPLFFLHPFPTLVMNNG